LSNETKQFNIVKEMLAITESIKKWRHYLIGNHFQIIKDQQSLRGLLTSACHTPEQQKWVSRLIGYNFDILYRPDVTKLSISSSGHHPQFS